MPGYAISLVVVLAFSGFTKILVSLNCPEISIFWNVPRIEDKRYKSPRSAKNPKNEITTNGPKKQKYPIDEIPKIFELFDFSFGNLVTIFLCVLMLSWFQHQWVSQRRNKSGRTGWSFESVRYLQSWCTIMSVISRSSTFADCSLW